MRAPMLTEAAMEVVAMEVVVEVAEEVAACMSSRSTTAHLPDSQRKR